MWLPSGWAIKSFWELPNHTTLKQRDIRRLKDNRDEIHEIHNGALC